MTQPLLTTKLYFPPERANLVDRPRLNARLADGLKRPLTLISAPAGYGKTTLLSGWRARSGSGFPLAWLALDPGDNNLGRFLTYVSAALETLDPRLTQDLDAQLHLPKLPPVEELITLLINGVAIYPTDFAFILDDCHVITDPTIHFTWMYLLDHLPPRMHLVMLTRSDPPIQLAKLRARGDIAELRADELRFTREEAANFFNSVMDLQLSAENVNALDQRTEGWIVGLQMAGLSMQGKADTASFIQAFTGSHRYILDYFAEEVLSRQSETIKTFLFHTSVLDQLTGPLCDAILGGSHNSAQTLVDLERKNLFLIALDDDRQWYRYHHLFQDLLEQHLKQTQPEIVNSLYERAAAWFQQNGYIQNAVEYALKARNFDLATRLIEQIKYDLMERGEIRLFVMWCQSLPEELIRSQPEIGFSYASGLTLAGYFTAAEKWIQHMEEGFSPLAASDPHAALRLAKAPVYRSIFARVHGDFAKAIALGQLGLDQTPLSEVRERGVALLFLGHAYFYAGNTEKAQKVLTDAVQTNLQSKHFTAFMNASHHLAQLRVLQGRLRNARDVYVKAIDFAKDQPAPILSGTEYAGLGDLKREWNQLDEAAIEMHRGLPLVEAGDEFFFSTETYHALIRLAISQKDWETAWSYLERAKMVARRCRTCLENENLSTWQAWLHLAQGRLDEASQWAAEKEPEITYPFGPQQEFTLLTLARVWLALGLPGQAASLLERLQVAADESGRLGRALQAHMLYALAMQAGGRESQAIVELIHVLSSARDEGYVRLFLDEGAPMANLLYKVAAHATTDIRDYAGKLLDAYAQDQAKLPVHAARTIREKELIEALSKREIEVLHLLADGCSNKEIASRLTISVGTVKRHVVHIFSKLNADNRTQAVSIARKLEII
jgi:LuxR family maltose regulon positive regulatory protein